MRAPFLLAALVMVLAPAVHAQDANNSTTATNTTTAGSGANATGNGTASAPPPVTFNLSGHQDGGEFYWTVDGLDGHNPTITVQPGQQVTFHVTSVSGVHNFKIGDAAPTSPITEGDSVDVPWTAPTTPGDITYLCSIHGSVMSGKITIASSTPPTPPTPAGPITINLVGHQDGSSFYWTADGYDGHNPTLKVQPGQQVTFHVSSQSGVHNFKLGDAAPSKPIAEGDSIDVQWTAPATAGTVTYLCAIHGSVMSGTIQVGSPSGGGNGGSGGGGVGPIAGDAIDLGDYGYPDCKGYKVPAIVTKHVTGGPTLSDYGTWCKSTGPTVRPPSSADYVIPISFALVAVGIVGMVWVHRAYKP